MRLFINGKAVKSFSYNPFSVYDEKGNVKYYTKLTGATWSGFFVYDKSDELVGCVRKNPFPLKRNLLAGNSNLKQETKITLKGQLMGTIVYEMGGRGFLKPDIKVDCMGWDAVGNTNAWKYYIIGPGGKKGHIFQEDNYFLGRKSVTIEYDNPEDEQMIVLLVAAFYLVWSTHSHT